MRNKRLKIIASLLMGLGLTGLQAQKSDMAAGGDVLGSGGSISYSVGQVFCQTYTGTQGSVAEGVQQPYNISVVTTTEEAEGINLLISAYPNPVTDYLILSVNEFYNSDLSYKLFDMYGNILRYEKNIGNQTDIFMSNLVPATYFVQVIKLNKVIKTFRIIKE